LGSEADAQLAEMQAYPGWYQAIEPAMSALAENRWALQWALPYMGEAVHAWEAISAVTTQQYYATEAQTWSAREQQDADRGYVLSAETAGARDAYYQTRAALAYPEAAYYAGRAILPAAAGVLGGMPGGMLAYGAITGGWEIAERATIASAMGPYLREMGPTAAAEYISRGYAGAWAFQPPDVAQQLTSGAEWMTGFAVGGAVRGAIAGISAEATAAGGALMGALGAVGPSMIMTGMLLGAQEVAYSYAYTEAYGESPLATPQGQQQAAGAVGTVGGLVGGGAGFMAGLSAFLGIGTSAVPLTAAIIEAGAVGGPIGLLAAGATLITMQEASTVAMIQSGELVPSAGAGGPGERGAGIIWVPANAARPGQETADLSYFLQLGSREAAAVGPDLIPSNISYFTEMASRSYAAVGPTLIPGNVPYFAEMGLRTQPAVGPEVPSYMPAIAAAMDRPSTVDATGAQMMLATGRDAGFIARPDLTLVPSTGPGAAANILYFAEMGDRTAAAVGPTVSGPYVPFDVRMAGIAGAYGLQYMDPNVYAERYGTPAEQAIAASASRSLAYMEPNVAAESVGYNLAVQASYALEYVEPYAYYEGKGWRVPGTGGISVKVGDVTYTRNAAIEHMTPQEQMSELGHLGEGYTIGAINPATGLPDYFAARHEGKVFSLESEYWADANASLIAQANAITSQMALLQFQSPTRIVADPQYYQLQAKLAPLEAQINASIASGIYLQKAEAYYQNKDALEEKMQADGMFYGANSPQVKADVAAIYSSSSSSKDSSTKSPGYFSPENPNFLYNAAHPEGYYYYTQDQATYEAYLTKTHADPSTISFQEFELTKGYESGYGTLATPGVHWVEQRTPVYGTGPWQYNIVGWTTSWVQEPGYSRRGGRGSSSTLVTLQPPSTLTGYGPEKRWAKRGEAPPEYHVDSATAYGDYLFFDMRLPA
jgi:hypothetical protein